MRADAVSDSRVPQWTLRNGQKIWLGEDQGQEYMYIRCKECERNHARWPVKRIPQTDIDASEEADKKYVKNIRRSFLTFILGGLGFALAFGYIILLTIPYNVHIFGPLLILWLLASMVVTLVLGIITLQWAKRITREFLSTKNGILNRYGLKGGEACFERQFDAGFRGTVILPKIS